MIKFYPETHLTINGVSPFHLNPIRNGSFQIAQRGTSFAAPANQAYDIDGWKNGNSSTAVFTVSQVAGSVTGRMARQVTITTADAAVASSDVVNDVTIIEGYDIVKYVGNTFTIAFRAKVPVTGIHCVALRNSGSDRAYVAEINFPVANTWQDCSFTVTGGLPTAGTWNYTNGVGLNIVFSHMSGSTFQTTPNAWVTGSFNGTANQVNDCATIGNVWAIEEVRMGLGTVAPAMETDYHAELARSQAYLQRRIFQLFPTYGSGIVYFEMQNLVTMRAAPAATVKTAPSYVNSSGITFVQSTVNESRWSYTITALGMANIYDGLVELSAEL